MVMVYGGAIREQSASPRDLTNYKKWRMQEQTVWPFFETNLDNGARGHINVYKIGNLCTNMKQNYVLRTMNH